MRLLVPLVLWALAAAGAIAQQPAVASSPAEPVTFSRDVAPILFKHCTACHRPGQSAPMSLLTYDQVRPWARAILRQVTSRTMPPWGADPAIGHFANDPSLTRDEIETVTRWVDRGAPKGDTAPPVPPAYNDEWQIGTPDLIVEMDKPFPVPASGLVEYQFFQIPTHLTEDRWVQAIEVRPGDPRVVHHLRVFAQPPGTDTRKPAKPGETLCLDEVCGNLEPPLVGYGPNIVSIAVGTQPDVYPAGSAKLLKAGSMLSLHMHYTTMGAATTDQTRIGFVFAKEPPATELKTVSMAQENFVIPPGAPSHLVQATIEFKEDALLHSLGPHSHLRGKSWAFELEQPDGSRRALLTVPRFDFNWQLNYVFESPIPVPAGSRLVGKAVYDNSPGNVNNPDPAAAVGWGNLTVQEMMFASVVYSRANVTSVPPRVLPP